MWTPDTHDAGSDPGPQEKRLYTDRWYQFYEDSYNYTTWMTLSTHRHVASNYAANWTSPVTDALANWNNYAIAPNTVYFSEISPPDPEHDVHIAVTSNCYLDFGVYKCTLDNLGVTYLFDELKHECQTPNRSVASDCDGQHSKPSTWWYALVLADDDEHVGMYGTAFQRQATIAHELGHAIVLKHDGLYDYVCGGTIPRTVMDYDCLDLNILNSPQMWDSCGINHAYHQPSIGFAGC